jgi:Bacterial Ig domain
MPKLPLALRTKVPVLLGFAVAATAVVRWGVLDRPSSSDAGGKSHAMQPLVCANERPSARSAPPPGNGDARKAAQQGLGFLTTASKAWTAQHRCFGCHVQAVTMEALSVGMHHQYDVARPDLEIMVGALELGVTAGGRVTGAAFQGQAWARYDAWVDDKHTNDLLKYAQELVGLQHEDGSIPDDDARLPITGGTMQTTYQSMQTWRQAFARTADDKWLAPMRKAERYLAQRAQGWKPDSGVYLQDLNFALLGLLAAGVGPGERPAQALQAQLLARQNDDGGWGLDPKISDALATGQTLYALRLAGHGDGEAPIDRGLAWLVQHQGKDGAWRSLTTGQGGGEKGEAMWAVLGLVAMDVTSVAVNGLTDGQHVEPKMTIAVSARDNQAGGVAKVELYVDDELMAGACADALTHAWKTDSLGDGKHTLDVVATNSRGQRSRRRYDVYAGNTYLTDLGTRFDEAKQATEIGVRNLANTSSAAGASHVELAVFAVKGANNERAEQVFAAKQASTPGAMTFGWDGKGSDGVARARGRYIAELAFRDAGGKVIQRVETLFVQDSEAAQRATYGEIEGQLSMEAGAAAAGTSSNTEVELVDQLGNVVQRVRSTEQGNFRFKTVGKGNYKIRTAKKGYARQEMDVEAAPAKPAAKADMKLKKH